MRLCQTEIVEQLPGRTAEAESVLHADTGDFDRTGVGDNLAHRVSQAADNVVLLNGDDSAGLLRRLDNDVAVNRLDGVNINQTGVDSLRFQFLDRLERLVDNQTRRDNRDVVALVKGDALAQLKGIGFGSGSLKLGIASLPKRI